MNFDQLTQIPNVRHLHDKALLEAWASALAFKTQLDETMERLGNEMYRRDQEEKKLGGRLLRCQRCGKPQPTQGPSVGTWTTQCHDCDDQMTDEPEWHRVDEQWRDPEENEKAGCL